jgi:RHS repeat-associated protein
MQPIAVRPKHPNIFGARYYDPALGRFMTPDWSDAPDPVPYADLSDPQSLNLYAYTENNPVTATDPDGHWCLFGLIGRTCSSNVATPIPKEGDKDPTMGAAGAGTLDAAADAGAAQADATFAQVISGAATSLEDFVAASPLGALVVATISQPGGDSLAVRQFYENQDKSGAQDKKLTPGEIEKLKAAGYDPEQMKKSLGAGGQHDLYKDPQGNIYAKPKGSPVKGEPTGVNINDIGGH